MTEHIISAPNATPGRRELDLEDITAGGYFTIGRHTFMVQRMNLDVTARAPHRHGGDPERELEEIDMRLVHARWKCCNA